MKKILIWTMMLTSILYVSCAKSEEGDEDKLGSIYGIVTNEGTANTAKGVTIGLYQIDGAYYNKEAGYWDGNDAKLLLKTTTFEDGHFEFTNLKPDLYFVVADPNVANEDFEPIVEAVTVEAGRQARVDMQIKIPGTIYGVITDSRTGNSLSDVLVELRPVNYYHYYSKYRQTTGKEGKYEFTDLYPQDYVLSISKYGYNASSTTVSLGSGKKVDVIINMTPL